MLVLGLAACPLSGSDDDSGSGSTNSSETGTTATTEAPDTSTTDPAEGSSSSEDTGTDTDTDTDTDTSGETGEQPVEGIMLDSECEPGAIEQMVQALPVPSDGTEVLSMPLDPGVFYRVVVRGTYVWGGCDPGSCPDGVGCNYARFGDAEVQSDDCWQTAQHGTPWSGITLHMNGADVDWRQYGTQEHQYARVHQGEGAALSFRINDCGDCYGDNSGQLDVEIWELPDDPRIWPNAMSCANSDAWLVDNHELIETMEPRLLVLDYDSASLPMDVSDRIEQAMAALREGSRYHGYEPGSMAAPALDPQLATPIIELRDAPPAPSTNGAAYPREDPVEGDMGLDYGAFFSEDYAPNFGVVDPDDPTRYLTLCEMVERGMIHELWFHANPNNETANGREVVEIKPYYDDMRVRLANDAIGHCAGNGCMDPEDFVDLPASCTRSLRLAFVDSTRGPHCLNHSLSHGFEGTGNRTWDTTSYIPYLEDYFREFAGFDLDTRYNQPFATWYWCDANDTTCTLSYPDATSVDWVETHDMTNMVVDSGSIPDYDPVCGNVHFPPNAPADYAWMDPTVVETSCTSYRMANGPGGVDLSAPYHSGLLDLSFDGDCAGPWDVWWRQNFPGHDNLAWDANGYRMLSWWPFLYY